ncbi:unnamed protein product [Moneuplotes crassus]|uniref:Uncharacterized protein n=2 Tax=Euplotes crassus TaxID=5936 RepID=A0AAD1XFF9_EUPCR|nr:unnamed protein product [Moneuplotes crassus]
MSVYNGFGTRGQETKYNKYLYNLCFLVQHSMTEMLSEEAKFDEYRFKKYFVKIITRMRELERAKYLPPKFSYAFENLCEHYNIELPEYTQTNSNQRLIKTSYNKRLKKSSSKGSSSASSTTGSMLGYFRKNRPKYNKSIYSSESSMSVNSRTGRIPKHKTSRKNLRSGKGVRIRLTKKKNKRIHTKSVQGHSMSSVNSSINSPGGVINERSDSESEGMAKTEYQKFETASKAPKRPLRSSAKEVSKSSNHYSIPNKTAYNSAFPNLKTEKVSNRLVKRKNKDPSEIGYLNFPTRSTHKISQMSNEALMKKNMEKLKNEMLQKSAAVGGALTQFKKRKQRRMIKQMMNEENNGYGIESYDPKETMKQIQERKHSLRAQYHSAGGRKIDFY